MQERIACFIIYISRILLMACCRGDRFDAYIHPSRFANSLTALALELSNCEKKLCRRCITPPTCYSKPNKKRSAVCYLLFILVFILLPAFPNQEEQPA